MLIVNHLQDLQGFLPSLRVSNIEISNELATDKVIKQSFLVCNTQEDQLHLKPKLYTFVFIL